MKKAGPRDREPAFPSFARGFSDAALDAHLDAMGQAVTTTVGGYMVEGPGITLFSRIEGDHFAVLGLPLLPLLGFLRQHGALPN